MSFSPTLFFRSELATGLVWWLLLLGAWVLLAPALGGHFIFDDFPNLQGLAEVRANPSFDEAQRYVTLGLSSSLGRPLSLMTFVMQYSSWPQDPGDFLYVNLLLHLLNGTLLFWWLLRWQRLAPLPAGAAAAAVAIAALWLLSPLQANAAFYIVQRMTELSATFVLAGMLLHTVGRAAAAAGRWRLGYLLMSAGAGSGLVLGTLAKESAALYPLLVLVFETTLLRRLALPPYWRLWRAIFLLAPLALLTAYLASKIPLFALQYESRPFTALERGLSETRILFDYLRRLVAPSLYGTRLMYDDFVLSKSLFQPWTTLVAVTAWLLLFGLALWRRARWPHFSFGVLWFLGAHALESTLLPLELAFEHRNYLAILGPLVAGAAGLGHLWRARWMGRLQPVLAAAIAAYLMFTAFCMSQTAALWGKPGELAEFWAHRQPESRRAAQHYANYLFMYGHVDEGRRAFERAIERWPHDPTMHLGLLQMGCSFAEMQVPDVSAVRDALRQADGHSLTGIHMMDGLLRMVESGQCDRYTGADLQQMTEAMSQAPALHHLSRYVLMLNSRAAELAGDRPTAMRYLEEAIQESPRIPLLKQAILWSLQAEDVAAARHYLDMAENSPRVTAAERWAQREDIQGMRQLVELYAEITAAP